MLTFFSGKYVPLKHVEKAQIYSKDKNQILSIKFRFFINSYSMLTTEGVPKLAEEPEEDPADGH